MASVALRGVHKVFRKTVVVEKLDLDIADGEFVVLVGPSGCGKSTTLNMIAGLEEPTEGEIAIGDRLVTSLSPKDRNVAMVFQNYALYPHMTVSDNLGFGLKVRRTPSVEIARRVAEVAETLGITSLLARKPRELSGGQRQRVALGRAIVRSPDVFLFDEPLSNLDAQLRVQMRFELKQLHQRLRATAIFVTHDQVEAMTLGSRLVVMNHGVIQQIGPPLDLYHQPRNRFVAEFIGSPAMNLFGCQIVSNGDAPQLESGGVRLELSPRAGAILQAGHHKTVVAGIRPEYIRLAYGDSAPAGTSEPRVLIRAIEPLGNQTYVRVGNDSLNLNVLLPADSPAVHPGQVVGLVLDSSKLQCFADDAEGKLLA